MVFSGIPFLYFFLPALLILYFISPWKLKNPILLLFSLFFYASGEPKNIIVMLLTVIVAYFGAIAIEKCGDSRPKTRRAVFVFTVIAILLPLLYFKYADFLLVNVNSLLGASIPLFGVTLPIGISFYTFQVLGYVCDVYMRKCETSHNIANLTLYVSLFPQLIAGPIVRYTDVENELKSREHTVDGVYSGIIRFSIGLFKKVLVANVLGELCSQVGVSALGGWMYAISSSLQIYYDFSGYSDMAIGLGSVFGFKFPENFNYPYISSSISEFWRRWHMTLGSWFRDYVYIPLGGNRVSFVKWFRNVFVVWMLTGLWHGAEWTFVLWGLYFGIFLVIEKLLQGFFAKLPKFVKHIYVLFTVAISFVIFDAGSLPELGNRLSVMFGSSGLSDATSLYYLRSYAITLITAVIGATPIVKTLGLKVNEKVRTVIAPIFALVILLVSTAYIIGGSYNPFLYFRF